ncbi:MAG: ATP-binding protein [Rhodospirillales bacterium]
MNLPKLVRTSAFRLTLLYIVLFGASVLVLLGFVSWSTMALIERQIDQTIEAEIRGLAEQYRERGLLRLIDVIHERSADHADQNNFYLLTDPVLGPIAGNLANWPAETGAGGWVVLTLPKRRDGRSVSHRVRARIFVLPAGYRLLVGRDMREKDRFRETINEAVSWSLALTLGFGLIGGVFMSRRMLARVDRLSKSAQGIIAGDLARRIVVSGTGDEFDSLAVNLNAMLDQIERLMTGMRLATDSIAHDLRGPLTRLKGRIELALRSPADAGQDREALADVLAQTDAALAVFDTLLKIATAEARTDPSDFQSLDLAVLAADAAELYEPVAEERGINLAVEAIGPAPIRGQPQLLAQAIANLLDNAVKHTPSGGRITVSAAEHAGTVLLAVADDGPGIPEPDRQRVLERFVRLEESRSTPGAGLGLSLVAAVAKLHDAKLQLDDNRPGLRVSIAFPTASVRDGTDERPPA